MAHKKVAMTKGLKTTTD